MLQPTEMTPAKRLQLARSIRSQVAKKVAKIMESVGMSRQRIWQLEMRKQGRCIVCGESAVSKNHCQKHFDAQRARSRKYARQKAGIPLNAPLHKRRTKEEMKAVSK